MTTATIIPMFPPGVHDLVREDQPGGVTRLACSEGDWLTVDVHTRAEQRWVMAAHALHQAEHRKPCHAGCYDDHGHTDGCLYEDGDG